MFKKMILGATSASALLFVMGAQAGGLQTTSSTGFYVGAQAGYAYSDLQELKSNIDAVTVETNKGGFDGRVSAGYRFNSYFGLETGVSYLPQSNYKESINGVTQKSYFSQFGVDLMGMGYLPLAQQFFLYAGVGAINVWERPQSTLTAQGVTVNTYPDYTDYIRPKVAAGLGYNVTQCVAVTAEYSRIFGNVSGQELLNNKGHGVASINAFTVGMQYAF